MHLFGVGRLNAVPVFRHLGVTSFDSASPLRKAWLDSAVITLAPKYLVLACTLWQLYRLT